MYHQCLESCRNKSLIKAVATLIEVLKAGVLKSPRLESRLLKLIRRFILKCVSPRVGPQKIAVSEPIQHIGLEGLI